MARKTLDLEDKILSPDQLAKDIANFWRVWDLERKECVDRWQEVASYIYATDTRKTSNSKLPWKNSTTIPKLCQIRDNLYANYRAVLFPKRKWLKWFPENEESLDREKASAVRDYMSWVVDQTHFKQELDKALLDYIDMGNAFGIPEWVDNSFVTKNGKTKVGYEGPNLVRKSPLDVVMNPTAASHKDTPYIVRSWHTIGELRKKIDKLTGGERDEALDTFNYLMEIRHNASGYEGDLQTKDALYDLAGFDSFRTYLGSQFVELLTFYGDLYDVQNNVFYENYIITIADRHKIVSKRQNESSLGTVPIIHAGWRKRQDSLWAMGPLENLVGIQYRIDHIENMKADVMDMTTFPLIKIKGYVEDFDYAPGERIYCQDDGDVELMGPDVKILQANVEIANYLQTMEEMAGAPKEALGFRTPGEKTAYEVQRLENAASRIFVNKATIFEEEFMEEALNGMLEQAQRKAGNSLINIFNEEQKIFAFRQISPEDISGQGRLKPIGARHFAEQAELIQNLTNFSNSSLGQDPMVNIHLSGKRLAKLLEDVLNVSEYNLFGEYVRLAEQGEAQQIQNQAEEDVLSSAATPSGLTPDDYDADMVGPPEEEETSGT